MDYRQEFCRLLTDWGPGHVMKTAYDTAWIARLGAIDREMSEAALDWICAHQLEDGSWGAASPMYYHDRVISTIAALNALVSNGHRVRTHKQVEAGKKALENMASAATRGLAPDPNSATVGFEMIVPTLFAEAEAVGTLHSEGQRILIRLKHLRELKVARLNGFRIHRNLSIAFSSEMAGPDCQHLLDLDNLQEANGSVAYSPSATAYYAQSICAGDPKALEYLRGVVGPDGGAPMAAPFDVYERAWVLWNLALAGPLDAELQALCQPHLDELEAAWKAKRGVGFGKGYSVQDGDDTSLVYAVLTEFGRTPDIEAVYHYEEDQYFRCYALEANPSISANVHILDVLRREGLESEDPAVQKILGFLRDNQLSNGYWIDKWHASPYYTTAHIVMAAWKYDLDLARSAVEWILKTQNADGSWGFYFPTAEETAYALQALCLWNNQVDTMPKNAIRNGAAWLEVNIEPPYPPLWIAKSLYYSEWVVRSEIISALYMAAQNS